MNSKTQELESQIVSLKAESKDFSQKWEDSLKKLQECENNKLTKIAEIEGEKQKISLENQRLEKEKKAQEEKIQELAKEKDVTILI